jgi:Rad3-related DNA helicase
LPEVFITHSNRLGEHETAVKNFRRAAAPKVLISPSVGTGYDFPFEDCEYQIISKVPYPDTRNPLVKARCSTDPDYAPYIAMQQLVQASGRGVRDIEDTCESFILDDNIAWFMPKFAHFAPEWFRRAYRRSSLIPKPAPKLKVRSTKGIY